MRFTGNITSLFAFSAQNERIMKRPRTSARQSISFPKPKGTLNNEIWHEMHTRILISQNRGILEKLSVG
jgi:hypothetical protein